MFLLVLRFIIRTAGRVFLLQVIGFFSVSIENFAVLTVMGRVRAVFFTVERPLALGMFGRMMLLRSISCRTLVFGGGGVVVASCHVNSEGILALRAFADFYEFVRSSSLRVETLIDREFSVRLRSFRYQDVHEVWL
jgi:hypothetical protein